MSKRNDKIKTVVKASGLSKDEVEFLYESNAIESEYGLRALEDAAEAWKYLKAVKMPMQVKHVLEAHRLLCRRIHPEIAGRIRNCAVWIGGHLKKAYPEIKLKEDLDEILLRSEFDIDGANHHGLPQGEKEAIAREHHVRAEEWHGFQDGNGRSLRLLWQWNRLQMKLPVAIIWAATKHALYYSWFLTDSQETQEPSR